MTLTAETPLREIPGSSGHVGFQTESRGAQQPRRDRVRVLLRYGVVLRLRGGGAQGLQDIRISIARSGVEATCSCSR